MTEGTMEPERNPAPAKYTSDWIEKLDGRTTFARLVADRLQALEQDLGGRDALSYQQRSLAKRVIWMEAVIEQQEAALARGVDIEHGKLAQAVNTLVGLLKTLGLERRAERVPSVKEYMQSREVSA